MKHYWQGEGVAESGWDDVSAAVSSAPYPVDVLAADRLAGQECLAALGITSRSWLGAVVVNSGGLLIDHGWLRVLGCGFGGLPPVEVEAGTGRITVGYDVLGGWFTWQFAPGSAAPSVHYFAPDDLDWQDLELGCADWLEAMLGGATSAFYDGLRWPGWEAEVRAVSVDQGLSTLPPLWTREGKDLATVSRKAIPLCQLVSVHQAAARQLGPPES